VNRIVAGLATTGAIVVLQATLVVVGSMFASYFGGTGLPPASRMLT
jgi:hypothetical protein